jgi:MFS family permease
VSTEKAIPPRWILSGSVLTAGFFLTGAGTIMLGVLLPVLSQKWGFRDDKAGFLLFLQFLGSTLGAILTGTDRSRSLKAGYGLLVLSAGTLAFAGQDTLFACFFVFGVGLGLVMTSTSLLFSDRYQNDRAIQLERLNFAWSAGAMIIPVLLLPFLRGANLRILFFTIGGLFLLLFLWVLVREPREWPYLIESAGSELDNPAVVERYLPLVLVVMCAVGVETALSGWLTTYSHRADPHGSGKEAFAIALFMFGIVLSRLGFSTSLLKVIGRQRAIFGSL